MRFDRVEGYLVRIPLKKARRVADASVDFCETVLCRLTSGGVSGWGEVAPGNSPRTTSQWSGATYLTLRDWVAPAMRELGAANSSEAISDKLAPLKGNRCAKAVFELAWQDLNAKLADVPLWRKLGGEKKPIKVGLSFDRYIEREEFFNELKRAVDERFARVTLKMRPGWDVQILNFSRVDSPAWLQLQVDFEGALDFEKHADTVYRMDDFFLNCVEQPLYPKDFVAHAMLKDAIRTPICLDESIESLEDAKIALDLEAARVVCLKPGRVGGHWEARRIADCAKTNGAGCYAGFDPQTSIGYRHTLAMASTANFTLPCDYERLDETLVFDAGKPIPTYEAVEKAAPDSNKPDRTFRFVDLWDEPGIGCEPNLDELSKFVLDKFEL